MEGLGLAMKLGHDVGYHFMGFLFSHRSSLPLERFPSAEQQHTQ
jgi:hypothetical protein